MTLCQCLLADITFISFHIKTLFQEKGKAIAEVLQEKIHR